MWYVGVSKFVFKGEAVGILKSPLLSLGARGTIGDTLTLQKRGQGTIVRKKPIPAYRYTLLQAYQRWLYEDYAYRWRQQSGATRQEYATAGSRYHLTGFQYWMKVMLLTMPDIVGWWRLDEGSGAVAHDSTPDPHHGLIVGPSPRDGVINGSYLFDGLNDLVSIDPYPTGLFTAFTLLYFMKTPGFTGSWRYSIGWKRAAVTSGTASGFHSTLQRLYHWLWNTVGAVVATWAVPAVDTWEQHGWVWDGTTMWAIRNSDLLNPQVIGGVFQPSCTLYLGRATPPAPADWFDGYLDNLIMFNRALDATEIARWAGRRYPP